MTEPLFYFFDLIQHQFLYLFIPQRVTDKNDLIILIQQKCMKHRFAWHVRVFTFEHTVNINIHRMAKTRTLKQFSQHIFFSTTSLNNEYDRKALDRIFHSHDVIPQFQMFNVARRAITCI